MAKRRLAELVELQQESAPMPKEESRDLGHIRSVGVGLRVGEVAEIDDLARSLGFSRNAIMAWIIRHSMREIRAGRLEIPVETENIRKLGKL